MSFWQLYYHLVWGTKHREFLIDDEIQELLQGSIRDSCTKHEVLIHGIGFMPDHVHMAVSIAPDYAISTVVKALKGSSTSFVNRHQGKLRTERFAWQPEYGVLSFGHAALEQVVSYVKNQKTRHAKNRLWAICEQLERPYERNSSPGGTSVG
jgi:putative transposase